MKKLSALAMLFALLLGAVSCAGLQRTTPAPYMPSPEYRFSPPYSAAFDLESSRGFTVINTGAVYPSYKWFNELQETYPVLRKYKELPQTGQISLLGRDSIGVARLVLTSTSEKDHKISIEAKGGEWLGKAALEGIGVAMPVDTVHLESGKMANLDIEVEAKEDALSGTYYLDVVASIQGYRTEAVFWLLISDE